MEGMKEKKNKTKQKKKPKNTHKEKPNLLEHVLLVEMIPRKSQISSPNSVVFLCPIQNYNHLILLVGDVSSLPSQQLFNKSRGNSKKKKRETKKTGKEKMKRKKRKENKRNIKKRKKIRLDRTKRKKKIK